MAVTVLWNVKEGMVDILFVPDRIIRPGPCVWIIIYLIAAGEVVIGCATESIDEMKGVDRIHRCSIGVEYESAAARYGIGNPITYATARNIGQQTAGNAEPACRWVDRSNSIWRRGATRSICE